MNPRPFATIVGLLLLILGVCGFVPPLAPPETDALRVAAGVGGPQLFGILPSSPALAAIHVALGLWGVIAGARLGRAVLFARVAGFIFLALTAMGTIPGADTLFGLAPLYGNNLLLHGPLAILGFLFGWLYRRAAPLPAPPPQPTTF
jgi:hypothetical protein